jgi:Fe-S-cluster-containing dehydrogenase component
MKTRGKVMDRREFLRGLGTTAAALGTGAVILQTVSLAQAAAPIKKSGMVIDTNRCIGCHGSTIACKSENNVPEGFFRSWVKQIIKGEYPHVKSYLLPRLCNNCEDAPCLNYCPTGATYRTPEDGVVHVDRDKCVGCHTCVLACPYNSRFVNQLTGTDAAFALGMMRWMMNHDRVDKQYLSYPNQKAAETDGQLTWTNATCLVRQDNQQVPAPRRCQAAGRRPGLCGLERWRPP